MAATMDSTMNLGGSIIRAPYSSAAAPSMADSLPSINFGFDDLRARMSSFTAQFDEFIERGRRRVLEERSQFHLSVAEIQEEHQSSDRALSSLQSKTRTHASTLAAQNSETSEMQSAISSLTVTRDTHAANVAQLRTRLSNARSAISTKKSTQRQQAQYLSYQAGFNGAELEFWEEYLGLRIESTGTDDRVRFVFSGCEDKRPDREAWFELDMSGQGRSARGYEVVGCRPTVREGGVEDCISTMCETEDLGRFLKSMRDLFVESMK